MISQVLNAHAILALKNEEERRAVPSASSLKK
jgi:hypothetical protein